MVSMFLYTCPYIGIHSQRYGVGSEVNITYLVQSVSILRQDLKLNLELTNSGRLVGQQASGILLCLPSQVLGWQIRTFHPFKMGIRDLNSGYPACKPSTLLTDPSHQTLFVQDGLMQPMLSSNSIWSRQWFYSWDLPSSTSPNAGIRGLYHPMFYPWDLKFFILWQSPIYVF